MGEHERSEAAGATIKAGDCFLTQDEAAALLRLSPRTLERHRCGGTGPRFTRVGRRILYARTELLAWTAARTFQSTAEADAARDGEAGR